MPGSVDCTSYRRALPVKPLQAMNLPLKERRRRRKKKKEQNCEKFYTLILDLHCE
jgi:hypothetical protein